MKNLSLVKKEAILKGWSGEEKYYVVDKEGREYFLKISPLADYEAKKAEFEMTQRLEKLGVPMSLPLRFGLFENQVYTLYSWLDGYDLGEVISWLKPSEAYALGLKAGQILQIIHSLPAPATREVWSSYFKGKLDEKLSSYQACPIKHKGGEFFIEYLNSNLHLLNNRPQTYHHGDYHLGNMILEKDHTLKIIDFNRNDYGDPWEEFNRIVWCAQSSPPFARARIDGYFDNSPPSEFWSLLALYIFSNTLASIAWARSFGKKEVKTMLELGQEVLAWYKKSPDFVPSWYKKP